MYRGRGGRNRRPAQPQPQPQPPDPVPATVLQAVIAAIWKGSLPWRVLGITLLALGSLFVTYILLPEEAMERLHSMAKKIGDFFVEAAPEPAAVSRPFPTEPKVVAIAPDSGFGTSHFAGLELGLLYDDDLSMLRLKASIADMKHGNVGELMGQLARALAQNDVVAVVGPGITECTRDVLQTVEQSGAPVVVFANSAAPRYLLETDRGTTPVFRINSGVDERADRLAQLTRDLLERQVRVLYLVEQNPGAGRKSFGQELDSQIRRKFDLKPHLESGLFQKQVFDSGKIADKLDELAAELGREQVVFLLGLGHDYKTVVERFYAVVPGEESATRANLVGVMASYAVDKLYATGPYLFSHLFEITDVDLRTNPGGLGAPDYFQAFLKRFQLPKVNPAHRDEAFAFDAGLSLSEAWKVVKEAHSRDAQMDYHAALSAFAQAVQGLRLGGVSGGIAFNRESLGHGFQNLGTVGTELTLCGYDPALRDWQEASPQALGQFARTEKVAAPAAARR